MGVHLDRAFSAALGCNLFSPSAWAGRRLSREDFIQAIQLCVAIQAVFERRRYGMTVWANYVRHMFSYFTE
jgi:hypothetical protein